MTAPEPPPDGEARCTYRERKDGPVCGRVLTDPASVALHVGPVHFRRLVGAVGGRKVTAVHQGQLVLDLDGDLGEDPEASAATERIAR